MRQPSENPYQSPSDIPNPYDSPSDTQPDHLYNEAFQRRLIARMGSIQLSLMFVVSIAFIMVVSQPSSLALRTVMAAAATTLTIILLGNLLAVHGLGWLAKQLASRLAEEGVDAADGEFVECSPAREACCYGAGVTNWDIGYLFLYSDSLVYVGERARFALRRDSLSAIRRSQAMCGWIPVAYVYVDYLAGDGRVESLHIGSGSGRSLLRLSRNSSLLFGRVRAWLDDPPEAEAPAWAHQLGPPEMPDVPSVPLPQFTARQLISSALSVALASGVVGAILGALLHQGAVPVLLAMTAANVTAMVLAVAPTLLLGESTVSVVNRR